MWREPNNNVFPFGNTTVPFRFCQVHDDVPAMVITGMSFRHNTATTTYAIHSVTIDAWMSTAITTAPTITGTFDNNHGADKVQVVTNRTYAHPVSNPSDVPGQFVLDYPLDIPFAFAGGGASLCWEVHVTAKTQTGSIIYDAAALAVTNPALTLNRAGTGCLATGRTVVMGLSPTATVSWTGPTGTMTFTGSNLLANGAVFLTQSFDKTQWNATPLPTPIPTSTGSPSGTCTLYADIQAVTFATATAAGGLVIAQSFVPDPSLHGLTLYAQMLGLDLVANPFGITSTNLAIHHIVAPFPTQPVARAYLSGSLGATGTASQSSYLVTKFY